MRILMPLGSVGGVGGVERCTSEAAVWLGRGGCGDRVDALYTGFAADDSALEAAVTSMVRVPALDVRLSTGVRALSRLAPAVRAALHARPDVVYVNRFEHLPVAFAARILTRVPVVCHLRYFSERRGLAWKSRMVDRFVAVSHATAGEWIAAGLDARRVDVIPDGVDTDRFRPPEPGERRTARERLGVREDTTVVLYFGRIHGEKGVDLLVDAWERLHVSPAKAELVVLGVSARADSYQSGLMARGVPGITWLPARDDVLPILHAADLVVAPSRHESFGRSIVESMSTGVPVVATTVEGIPETMKGFEEFLVAPDDPGALADKIEATMRWRADDAGLGARCRDHVTTRFSQEASLMGLYDVLRSVAR